MHATTWINLENIVQLEKLVTKDTGIAQFHLQKILRIGKSIETKKQSGGC